MRGFFGFAVATATALFADSLAAPLIAHPGTEANLVITEANTLNDSAPGVQPVHAAAATSGLTLAIHNNFGAGSVNAYVTARDPNGASVILKSDGTWYRPDPAGSTTPVLISSADIQLSVAGNGVTEIILPTAATSGRVYVVEGDLVLYTVVDSTGATQVVEPSFANLQDPNAGLKWGFVEFSATADGAIYANLSFVDFIGTLFGIAITLGDGSTQQVPGLQEGAMESICNGLSAQAATDGQPWDQMCITDGSGSPLRILSPNIFVDNNKTEMSTYYTNYVDQVWTKYTDEDLILATSSGNVSCRVNTADQLICAGDSSPWTRPAVLDIWGCNDGAFAKIDGNDLHEVLRPILCAAFERTTLLLDGGNVQPSLSADYYYVNSPTNHYARLVHQYEVGNRGYAFSFDDVNPSSGVDQSGTLSGPNAQRFDVYVGGFQGTTTTTSVVSTTTTMATSATTLAITTSTQSAVTTTTITTAPATTGVAQWDQCGGDGYTGPTQCASPYTCVALSQWWSQCE